MSDPENQIRTNVHQLLLQLWPDNPANLRKLPASTDRQAWFAAFVAEKRLHWQAKQAEFLRYGRHSDAQKEAIKLNQLELSLQQLSAERRACR